MKNKRGNLSKRAVRRSFLSGIYLSVITAFVFLIICFIIFRSARATIADDQPQRYKYYTSITVEKGESLWSIAEKYAGREYKDLYEYIDEVMEINGLKNTDIKAGYHLCIPYYSEEFK